MFRIRKNCEMVMTARGGELGKITALDYKGDICNESHLKLPVPVTN